MVMSHILTPFHAFFFFLLFPENKSFWYVKLGMYNASHSKRQQSFKQFFFFFFNSKNVELWSLENRIKGKSLYDFALLLVGFGLVSLFKKKETVFILYNYALKKQIETIFFFSFPKTFKRYLSMVSQSPTSEETKLATRISSCLYRNETPHVTLYKYSVYM